MAERRLVGRLRLDSAQIYILDPVGLPTEESYKPVAEVSIAHGAGQVGDGVVVATGADSECPVYVDYNDNGQPTKITIDLVA